MLTKANKVHIRDGCELLDLRWGKSNRARASNCRSPGVYQVLIVQILMLKAIALPWGICTLQNGE